MCMHTYPLHASESLCVCVLYVCVLSVHTRVIQYPYRGPCLLLETHSLNEQMKNELKNNRRKGERQNKQWEKAVAPNMWLVQVCVCVRIWMCVHMRYVFILWLHYALVLDVLSPSECVSVNRIFSAFVLTEEDWSLTEERKKKKRQQLSYIITWKVIF